MEPWQTQADEAAAHIKIALDGCADPLTAINAALQCVRAMGVKNDSIRSAKETLTETAGALKDSGGPEEWAGVLTARGTVLRVTFFSLYGMAGRRIPKRRPAVPSFSEAVDLYHSLRCAAVSKASARVQVARHLNGASHRDREGRYLRKSVRDLARRMNEKALDKEDQRVLREREKRK